MLHVVRVRVFARLIGLFALGAAVVVPATASAHPSSARTLRPGMHGSDVSALQRALTQAGFRLRATGVYDAPTARTVRSFERRYRLRVDGVASPRFVSTLRKVGKLDREAVDRDAGSGGGGLGSGTTTTTTGTPGTTGTTTGTTGTTTGTTRTTTGRAINVRAYGRHMLRKGMHGRAVRALQNYLTLAGFQTSVDGQFGPATRKSVVAWQEANGISPANGVMSRGAERRLKRDVTTAVTSTTTTGQATLNSDGTVSAPAGAPAQVVNAIAAANSIIDTPYIYGGGHGSFDDSGYDCSGAVSFALHGGGLLSTPEDSTQLERFGQAGKGQWITVYADSAHAFVVIAGLAFDTAHYGRTFPSGSGPRWLPASAVLSNLSDGGDYVARHPAGL